MSVPLEPHDVAAYEQFCSELVQARFTPLSGTERRRWSGPLHPALTGITTATHMQVWFYDGWPFKYAHIVVPELSVEHAANGIICLWAEDDPAQIKGSTLPGLFDRLEQWAARTATGFTAADEALDAHIPFEGTAQRFAEIDLPNLLTAASNGHMSTIYGTPQGDALLLDRDSTKRSLTGSLYYRSNITTPPRTLTEFRNALTRRQRSNLDAGLAARQGVGQNEVSGGHDHVALVWPRHSQHDAIILSFSGTGPTLTAHPNATSPSDTLSRLRRAGPDAALLSGKKVLLAGLGALGGHVAMTLAHSGVTYLHVCDSDLLHTVNLVRHALDHLDVGYQKPIGLAVRLQRSAPWCKVKPDHDLPHVPSALIARVRGHDLVIDCTGIASMTSALAYVCAAENVPMLSSALFHQGAISRIRRQQAGDTPLLHRAANPAYLTLPPDQIDTGTPGFLELGCTAPVHNAPPVAVLRAAADTSHAALDVLTGRLLLPDECITVLRPLNTPPFDQPGVLIPTDPTTSAAAPAADSP